MDVGEVYGNVRNSWPVRVAIAVVVEASRPVWGRAIGASLTEPEILQRKWERPIVMAEQGLADIRRGEEEADTELRDWGEATMAQAVFNAAGEPGDLVVRAAVTELAASVLQDVSGNQFVAPPVASTVKEVLVDAPKHSPEVM